MGDKGRELLQVSSMDLTDEEFMDWFDSQPVGDIREAILQIASPRMTLWDYYVAHAPVGLITRDVGVGVTPETTVIETTAENASCYADCVLAERAKREGDS